MRNILHLKVLNLLIRHLAYLPKHRTNLESIYNSCLTCLTHKTHGITVLLCNIIWTLVRCQLLKGKIPIRNCTSHMYFRLRFEIKVSTHLNKNATGRYKPQKISFQKPHSLIHCTKHIFVWLTDMKCTMYYVNCFLFKKQKEQK